MYTDPTGHREYCEDEKGGRCPKEKPKKPTYNGETFPDWGKDQSDEWRQKRADIVWNWLCNSSKGCPSSKQLAAWLLWQEGGLLYNGVVINANSSNSIVLARQAIIGFMESLFKDGMSAEDLSKFTPFFNPDSGGAFTPNDWRELNTPPPSTKSLDYSTEVDKYWDLGPVRDTNDRVIDHWWTNTESNPCSQCTIVFSITVPAGVPDFPSGGSFYFGYLP
jgi:hypothetical protein